MNLKFRAKRGREGKAAGSERCCWSPMISHIYQQLTTLSATWIAILALVGVFPSHIGIEEPIPEEEPPKNNILIAEVTAYSSSLDETQGDPFITASGQRVRDGIIACSREYPFGTRFLIEGKLYVCLDRLARKYDHRIDIWKPNKAEALQFGRRELPIEVFLDGIDEEEEIALLDLAIAGEPAPQSLSR